MSKRPHPVTSVAEAEIRKALEAICQKHLLSEAEEILVVSRACSDHLATVAKSAIRRASERPGSLQ